MLIAVATSRAMSILLPVVGLQIGTGCPPSVDEVEIPIIIPPGDHY